MLPECPIPVHVVFSGSGQFHYDNSAGSHAIGDDTLDWDVDYQALLSRRVAHRRERAPARHGGDLHIH